MSRPVAGTRNGRVICTTMSARTQRWMVLKSACFMRMESENSPWPSTGCQGGMKRLRVTRAIIRPRFLTSL